MKKIFLLAALLFLFQNGYSQRLDTIPIQKEAFIKGLVKILNASKNSDLKELTNSFEDDIKKGTFDEYFFEDLAKMTNKMILMRGNARPQLSGVLSSFIKMNKLRLNPMQWKEWLDILEITMDKSKSGDTKTTLKFLDFSYRLYKEKALYYSKAKTWSFNADKFVLKYTEKGPIVELGLSEIIGKTKGDSLTIKNTIGEYVFFEEKWYGVHGATDWKRAGLPEKEVFCTFNDYIINMNTQAYTVNNVLFSFKNYFGKELRGTLYDKLVINNSSSKSSYPKFEAKREDVPAQLITENVVYQGGFTLSGSTISGGTETEKSYLTIYKPGTTQKVIFATLPNITINKPIKISSLNASVSLYFDNDSIYHPTISLYFDLKENKLKLIKGDGSLASSKFWDSYHNVEFEADKVEWAIKEDYIDINTVSTSGFKAATYESKNFFNKPTMRKVRGNVSYDPLSVLNIYHAQTNFNEISDIDYAKKLSPNLTVKQIQSLLFSLIREGFITWDKESGIITIKEKIRHYVMSNAKKKDFDNIQIVSKTKNQNGRLNLLTKNIEIEGVNVVPISKATQTQFFPDSLKLQLKKNRDMEFNGFFSCGRMDFFGQENEFIYDDFKLNIPKIDTMIIYIPDGIDNFDQYGNQKLRPLNTTIENIKGSLEINHPNNKSGRVNLPEYPKLHSTSKSQIYFDSKMIRSGTYSRENFYYELEPFDLDSLQHIEPSNVEFKGELYSADIFPKITEPIRVQSDLSLGFSIESPPNGFDIYKGNAKFMSDITLNGKGLSGNGIIEYRTVSFESSNIQFYPDSLHALTDTLGVAKSKGVYESPWVKSANNEIKYYPYIDSMWASSNKDNPFRMYGEIMDLDGTFSVTGKGISGTGTADWDDATLISNHFIFKADEMFADTAELIIKSLDGDKVTFNTPNVNAAVDFIKNTGFFKSNTNDNRTEFGYNKYETDIDEFFWDIDEKILEFTAKEGTGGATFKSLRDDQDSLRFKAEKAIYNLQTSIIDASGIKEIFVADSRIIPDSGKIIINPNAIISTLNNAVIEANAISKKHRIEKAVIDIKGKNNIKASGDYVYKTKDTEDQYIKFPSINIVLADSSVITKKKKGQEKVFAINAKGQIGKFENFILYPNVSFYGNVEMFSTYDKLKIKGFTKIDFQSKFVNSDYYEIDSEVDPENLEMNVSKAKDPGGSIVRTGIFISKSGLEPLYTEILNNQIGPIDIAMIETNGILSHDYEKDIYTFGTQEKIDKPELIQAGNILEFNPKTGEIHAEGLLDFGTQYGVVQEKIAGSVDVDLNDKIYSFNTTISFPFKFDKDIIDKMAYYMEDDNFDADDADYTKKRSQNQLAEFFKPKDLKKVLSEIEENGIFSKPKSFKENFMISDVDLVYDSKQRSYKSLGKFTLSFIGDKGIHKRVNGYIELGHRMGADYYNIYIKTTLGDWIFISFDGGATPIQIVTSFDNINSIIGNLDVKKRTIKGENKDQFIVYTLGQESKAVQFSKRMKAYKNEK